MNMMTNLSNPCVPPDRHRPDSGRRWIRRLAAAGFLAVLVSVSVFVILRPDPAGHGTHEQLGLPACLFREVLGIERCPSCGLTTAFTLAYHGELYPAIDTNPLILIWFPLHILAGPYLGLLWWRPSARWLCGGGIVLAAAMIIHAVYWLAGMAALLAS
jgi:hypothetical protein